MSDKGAWKTKLLPQYWSSTTHTTIISSPLITPQDTSTKTRPITATKDWNCEKIDLLWQLRGFLYTSLCSLSLGISHACLHLFPFISCLMWYEVGKLVRYYYFSLVSNCCVENLVWSYACWGLSLNMLLQLGL